MRRDSNPKEWATHWHCDKSVQNVEDKPWKNDELKKLEEASPRLKCDLERVSRLCKAKQRPIALMPTSVRWWEALRAPEVAKWQQKYRAEWDATDGRNGGSQQTVWEVLMEKWRDLIEDKSRGSRGCGLGFWSWRRPSSGSVFLWCGPWRRTSASQ